LYRLKLGIREKEYPSASFDFIERQNIQETLPRSAEEVYEIEHKRPNIHAGKRGYLKAA